MIRVGELSDLTPELLTELLTAGGALRAGRVTAVTPAQEAVRQGFVSNASRVEVTYSPDAAGDLPRGLFLKVTRPDLHPEYRQVGRHEVAFYTEVLHTPHDLPVARCYHGEWDAGAGQGALLLADLTPTHMQRPLPLPPGPQQCERIVESLADIHARWWGHPQLGATIGAPLDPAAAQASLRRLEASYPQFLDALGDALLPAQRDAYARIMASPFLQGRAERLIARRAVTLIHGDAHTNNLMLPRDPAQGRAVLIDWQRWSIDMPPYDLAFLIALHWTAERRAALERPLLRHYHEELLRNGVTGYSWEDCWDDYRACVIVMALIPIGQHRRGMPAGVVWYGMEQSVAALHDLRCEELL
jgi:aminoglycoside phosphotransferase (APT) family kinase protein